MPDIHQPFCNPVASPLSYAVALRESETLKLVRTALEKGDAFLAYQPVVMAANPARAAYYEGLMRVRDPAGRIIPARDFIEASETTETGRRIDTLALSLGLDALSRNPGIRLAVNMSARSIGYGPWIEALDRGLSADPTAAERLILEVTESSAMEMPDTVVGFMDELQSKGVSFALDDFGAGYTAFRYLREFFFDAIKIDGQFIQGIATNPDNQVLARALISIGQHFEMFTVAEMVSSSADAEFLAKAGIDCLQGYHYGAPSIREPWVKDAVKIA